MIATASGRNHYKRTVVREVYGVGLEIRSVDGKPFIIPV